MVGSTEKIYYGLAGSWMGQTGTACLKNGKT